MKNSQNNQNNQKNTLSDNSHFILYNTSNYKEVFNNSVPEILNKFVDVILEYMRFISEKRIMKNKLYYRFIFESLGIGLVKWNAQSFTKIHYLFSRSLH